jgi:hypothetical protein
MRGHLLPFGDQVDDLHLEIGERVPENPGNITGRRRAVGVERKHVEEAGMARVRLRDIVNSADRAAVMGLRRGPGQDQYLNSMEEIFAEASEEQRAMPHPWAVHDAGTGALIGFTMISDNVPQPMDDDLVGPLLPVEAAHRLPVPAPWLRRRDARRGRGLSRDAARRRHALHQLRGWPRLAARVLPPLRLHRHGPGHVGRERPRARPSALTEGSLDHLHPRRHAQIASGQRKRVTASSCSGRPDFGGARPAWLSSGKLVVSKRG